MQISETTFRLLLLFFPGIICAKTVSKLLGKKPEQFVNLILSSFVYGVLSYFFYWLPSYIYFMIYGDYLYSITVFDSMSDNKGTINFLEIGIVSVIALFLAMVVSFVETHKYLHKFANWFRISKKFGEQDVWEFTLDSEETNFVTVRDLDYNLIYDGWIEAFSDHTGISELLIRDVSVYRNNEGTFLYRIDAMYLSRKRDSITLEFRGNELISD